jgi:hypothetical protein
MFCSSFGGRLCRDARFLQKERGRLLCPRALLSRLCIGRSRRWFRQGPCRAKCWELHSSARHDEVFEGGDSAIRVHECRCLITVTALMNIDVMAFDHAAQGFPVDAKDACRCLFVSARMTEDTGDVTSFDFRQ